MSLPGTEFIRRFPMHVLPQGLMRIRHYGFLANRCRKIKLKAIRTRLKQIVAANETPTGLQTVEVNNPVNPGKIGRCPKCHQGLLQVMYIIIPTLLTGG